MNTRRGCLAAGAAWPVLAWTGALRAQPKPPVVIGWLSPNAGDRGRVSFVEGMSALGWKLGAQYVLEGRWAQGQVDRLPGLAQEIAATKPAIIVTITSSAARAAAAAAPATPIVLANGDPISTGLVQSLARPGGMITGLSNLSGDLNQKLVEILVEARPTLRRIGFLANPADNAADVRRAAERLHVQAVVVGAAGPQDIEPVFVRLAEAKVQALVLLPSSRHSSFQPKIIGLAMAQRWPVVGTLPATARLGGLFSYGADRDALIRRSAHYVERILKGAKPGDLPIEQPTTFEMVLNMKTAKTLGITIPQSILIRATEVIE